jgi:hypothetical protein
MKHHKNSRAAAWVAPPSQQQVAIAAAFVRALQQQAPFSAFRSSAPTLLAAPQTSPRYVFPRTPAVAIEKFLINVPSIRNHRKQLKTITPAHFWQ